MELSPWTWEAASLAASVFTTGTVSRFHRETMRATHNGLWPRVMRLIARKIERFMKSHRVLSLILWELEVVARSRHFMSRPVTMFCPDLSVKVKSISLK